MKFNGMHSIETILGLVGASLVVKLIENCSDKYCRNEEVQQVIHDVEQELMKIFYTMKIIMTWRRLEH